LNTTLGNEEGESPLVEAALEMGGQVIADDTERGVTV